MDRAKIRDVFADAIALPPDRRGSFIHAALDPDAEAVREVLSLLEANERAGDFLADSAINGTRLGRSPSRPTPANEGVGTQFDGYTLQKLLGEGGFGLVYMAEQTTPLKRWVAVKILKAGVDTAAVLARFEAERQVLALLEHPNIARVYGAGISPAGRPYFAMELVRGVPITHFCDEHHLTVSQRLALFVLVCRAVQHAHQKGVIHRDLKPANILVAMGDDGHPDPKIIDFGIAKALAARPADSATMTIGPQLMGTPAYMSPEQADPVGVDVDTRADVYALGVILYELLTSTPPLDPKTLHAAGIAEIQRMIREVDPPAPSTRLSALGERLSGIASDRGIQPPRLGRLLRGELDWIVMRALEKERQRRYESASAFAEDIDRYLTDEPVRAGPPTLAYRSRKFIRRNRALVATGAVVLASLVFGLGAATAGFFQASRDRDTARLALLEADRQKTAAQDALAKEEAQRKAAERNADRAKRLVEFGDVLIGSANPDVTLSSQTTAREMLDRAAAHLDDFFAGHPDADWQMRARMGVAYVALGDDAKALPLLRDAVQLMQAQPDASLWDRFWFTFMLSYTESFEQINWLMTSRKAWKLAEELVTRDDPSIGPSLNRLRDMVGLSGERFDNAAVAPVFAATVEAVRRDMPMIENRRMPAIYSLWHVARAIHVKNSAAALPFYRQVVALAEESLPQSCLTTIGARNSVIDCLLETKRFEEAAFDAGRWADAAAKSRDKDNPIVALLRGTQAIAIGRAGRPQEAIPTLRNTVETLTTTRGPGSSHLLWQLSCLLEFLEGADRKPENDALRDRLALAAASCHTNALTPTFLQSLSLAHQDLYDAVKELDALWTTADSAAKNTARAKELVTALCAARERIAPQDPIRDHFLGRWLTYRIFVWGNRDAQDDLLLILNNTALAAMQPHDADDTNCYGWALTWNARLNLALGNYAQAESSARASVTRYMYRGIPEDYLARALLKLKRPQEAVQFAQFALDHNTEQFGLDAVDTRLSLETLFDAYEALGRLPELLTRHEVLLKQDAQTAGVSPVGVRQRAWLTVRTAAATPEQARLALAALGRLSDPDNIEIRRITGLAQIRTGDYAAALTNLSKGDELAQSKNGRRFPSFLAYMAIAHKGLGDLEKAREFLRLSQELVAHPDFATDSIANRAVKEAVSVVGSSTNP